jgi:hypothetical protein
VNVTKVGCGVVGGTGVDHPVGHGRGGAGVDELKQPARNDGSHSPNHDVEGSNCCGGGMGGKGGVSEGPTCQRRWIAVELDACIAQRGVQYIGGRDPPRAGGQEGGGQGRRL